MQFEVLQNVHYNPPDHEDDWREWQQGDVIDEADLLDAPLDLEWLLSVGAIRQLQEESDGEV